MTALTDYECGVLITRGPQDWEIIQQENGAAEVIVSGVFKLTQITGNEKVYARVVHEGTREEVVPYTQCFVEGHEWFIKLKVPAGGLYMLETVLNNDEEKPLSHSVRGDVRKHFGVGDVYLIAGQSNAVGYGKEPVNDPPELGVHCLYARGKWELAVHPLADATETLHPVNREHMNPGISPYLRMAKILHQKLGYPIGLIPTAKGGSPLRRWNKDEAGDLYQNMLDIVGNRKLTGVLWYQGESDTFDQRSDSYFERFTAVVQYFREDLHQKDLPFYTVQINKKEPMEPERGIEWKRVQKAQEKAAEQIPNVYMVLSSDSGLSDTIHNNSAGNMVIGERLAEQILKVQK